MAEFFRWFALAALLMVLFGGCIGSNAPKEPAASSLMSTTTEKMTTTSLYCVYYFYHSKEGNYDIYCYNYFDHYYDNAGIEQA